MTALPAALPALLDPGALPSPEFAKRLRAYARAADIRIFSAWCAAQGWDPLPADPETVAASLDAMAAAMAPATVRRYRASIVTLHCTTSAPDPPKGEVVRLAVKRMHRAKGTR